MNTIYEKFVLKLARRHFYKRRRTDFDEYYKGISEKIKDSISKLKHKW